MIGLAHGPVCTASTTVLAEGAVKVASVLVIYVHPTVITHNIGDARQYARRQQRALIQKRDSELSPSG